MPAKLITLTSDFGLKDPYVAEMKAAILRICPDASIVDITHKIAKFNIRIGAYVLASATPYFPKETIHVAVIDPGVGTRRRPILIQTQDGFFVGPDNGLLILAAEHQGVTCIREITNSEFMLPLVSSTFHGRDVFAPVAAHLANGVPPSEFGPEICDVMKPDFAKITMRQNVLVGEVLHVDDFGNIVTNISEKDVARLGVVDVIRVELSDQKLRLKFCKAYGEVKPQEPLALLGSHNYLEISINQGNAARTFKAGLGKRVKLSLA